jgi:hypothetical protein
MTLKELSKRIDNHVKKINEQTEIIKSIDKKIWTPIKNEGQSDMKPLDMCGFENWRND